MNPYFALESPASLSGWTPLAALTEPAALRTRVRATQVALGPGPLRAAASVDFLGVAARVLSPVLAAFVTAGAGPRLSLDTVWWRPAVPGPMRLAVTATGSTPSFPDAVLDPVLAPLVQAYARTFALSRRVLWGDVASALNGAAVALGRGTDLVAAVLAAPPLAGTARALPPRFVRNSCCLIYRLDGYGTCADCILPGP